MIDMALAVFPETYCGTVGMPSLGRVTFTNSDLHLLFTELDTVSMHKMGRAQIDRIGQSDSRVQTRVTAGGSGRRL